MASARAWEGCEVVAFKDRLRELREAAGLTQYALAKKAGISKQAMNRLENGSNQPTWDTVQLLATALGVSTEVLRTDGGAAQGVPAPEPQPQPPAEKPARKPTGRKKP